MIERHPWGGLADPAARDPADFLILGLPYDGAVSWRPGAAQAPRELRAISATSSAIAEDGYIVDPARLRVRDLGDLAPPASGARGPAGDAGREVYFQEVEQAVVAALGGAPQGADPFLFTIGGDHSVTIPLARAFARRHPKGFGLVLLDAHPDLFDSYEGSPLSHACPMRRALDTGALRPEHLLIVGTRSYHAVELDFMRERQIRFVPARELAERGRPAVLAEARERLAGVASVYLTLDIDVADPACAPGTGAPVAGGLSSRELLDLTRGLLEELPVRAMDVVEVSPPLDPTQATLFLALQLAFETFAVVARKRALVNPQSPVPAEAR